ncbi:MAG: hypothetical protein A3A98_00225 [Candidatus Staskawiczbacteria bacterium RIFCSPLOWO2_01_FULL_40_39]|uniref:UPF0102 protein A2730_00225 n=1 Tax=Candidatus Staskawiczbacteria bacterium RIFCSPHIGHO2_01_FULL_39_25 TaxID=1802202 RepID=A0A1G2HMH7_9BACT|nr:MAG: hypothetical protein A2730_00225 [Candidatus Staskawiczbacteria bacterium RIFCSPHIGHO2_01_FULL_39_25]OGZ73164.1 MAG: hypothetical protein A3A98_00225 [Candidatus Staskawiczbacteria bacterium RIFCSPLOWO2_01_FULL_40_39]
MTTKELGELGEKMACEYLVRKGYNIIGKNYRISFGEIDIIARKKFKFFARFDSTIHFIEVKSLKATSFQSAYPEEHVDFRKQRKLKQMAEIWLEKNKYQQNHPYQIDVIGILVNENTRNAKLHYFPNVVEEI